MRRLWNDWRRVAATALAARRRLLIVDFDGTLARIERMPASVRIAKAEFEALSRMSRSRDCRVVIISGRSLKDLIPRVGRLPRAIYVGNHGLEMRGGGLRPPPPAKNTVRLRARVRRAAAGLAAAFKTIPGVWVEDKGFGVSVHYRNVPPASMPAFRRRFSETAEGFASADLIWTKGKKIRELRPAGQWDKGRAAHFILDQLGGYFPIVIGDDKTDEEMFKAINGKGVTVRVGHSGRSAAQYYVDSQADVSALLRKLCA